MVSAGGGFQLDLITKAAKTKVFRIAFGSEHKHKIKIYGHNLVIGHDLAQTFASKLQLVARVLCVDTTVSISKSSYTCSVFCIHKAALGVFLPGDDLLDCGIAGIG